MKRLLTGLILTFTLWVSGVASADDVTIASWNVKRLGHGDQQSYKALAYVASHADLIALQEVMTPEAAEKFREALQAQTKESWSLVSSSLIGTRNYKEMYSFVSRDSVVAYVDGAVVFLDRANTYIREPFSARYRSVKSGRIFALATVHILYGKSVADRTPEIRALGEYWKWLSDVYPGTPLILSGDFNLPPTHDAWRPLAKYAIPLIRQGGTTLSGSDGIYANLFDNFWISRTRDLNVTSAGIIDYPKLLGWSHDKSRSHASDHAPIFMTLGAKRLSASVPIVSPAQAKRAPARNPSIAEVAQAMQGAGSGMIETAKSLATRGLEAMSNSVRGNSNSMIFHRKDCPNYERVGASHRVEFGSQADAERAGYRIAGNCPQT